MKTRSRWISFFILALALSALTCNFPAPTTRLQTTPPPGAATPVISGTPTLVIASSNVPGVQVSVVPVASPQPIAAKDFAALNVSLAEKIAALNQAELKFIRDVQASSRDGRLPGLASPLLQKGALTEQNLKDIAGTAMDAAILSDQLGELSARQDKGSQQAAQSADQYVAIARTAFSLVIDAQNLRTALPNNLVSTAESIQVIAGYGAQLWNASVTGGNTTKGNPFTALTKNAEPVQALNPNAVAQVQAQINAGNSSIWIAQSAAQTTKTLNVPAAQSPVSNPFDQQVLRSLTTAEGQSDGNQAQQVAAANLQRLGAATSSSDPSKPMQLQVPTNPIAVSGGEQIKAGTIPTFKQGSATAVSKNNPADENAFMQSVGLTGEEKPSDQGKTTVQDKPALVNLRITNVVIKNVNKLNASSSIEAEVEVDYSFTVNWSTTLAAPLFRLSCNRGPLESSITQVSGALTLNTTAVLQLSPGVLYLSCWATPPGDFRGQLGSTSMGILVGDAAEATKRAIKSKTEIAAVHGTQTAVVQATLNASQTQAAAAAKSIATSNAVATEVYGTKTAEFKLTAAAAETARMKPTPTATPAGFTMNGTFSITFFAMGGPTGTAGIIHLTVNPISGLVNGDMNGSATWRGQENCKDGNVKNWTNHREFSGTLSGSVDTKSGVLSSLKMTGKTSYSHIGGCYDPINEQNRDLVLHLRGTVDLKNHTAKGQIFTPVDATPANSGEGDWHAGE